MTRQLETSQQIQLTTATTRETTTAKKTNNAIAKITTTATVTLHYISFHASVFFVIHIRCDSIHQQFPGPYSNGHLPTKPKTRFCMLHGSI
jgi:hypothetical protein